jgi:hypothetical protein
VEGAAAEDVSAGVLTAAGCATAGVLVAALSAETSPDGWLLSHAERAATARTKAPRKMFFIG